MGDNRTEKQRTDQLFSEEIKLLNGETVVLSCEVPWALDYRARFPCFRVSEDFVATIIESKGKDFVTVIALWVKQSRGKGVEYYKFFNDIRLNQEGDSRKNINIYIHKLISLTVQTCEGVLSIGYSGVM